MPNKNYRLCTVIIWIIFSFFTLPLYAQQDKRVEVIGAPIPMVQMYFIAEIHSIEEKGAFNYAMTEYLARNCGVSNIFVERGCAYAYLLNKCIYENDTTFFGDYGDAGSRERLDKLRTLNASLPAGKQLRFCGMDFERMEFTAAVKMILRQNKQAAGTKLYQYIAGLPDSICHLVHKTMEQTATRIKVYGEARALFRAEKETLQKVVKQDYESLEQIMENPTLESKFSRRDRGMRRNIEKQAGDKPFLCIAGRYHLEYTRHEIYHSLVKKMVRHNRKNAKNMVIFDEVQSGRFLVSKLWSHEGAPDQYDFGTGGPRYFIRNDSAMAIGFSQYNDPCCFQLVHKDIFKPLVSKDNHGLNSYYVFFGGLIK